MSPEDPAAPLSPIRPRRQLSSAAPWELAVVSRWKRELVPADYSWLHGHPGLGNQPGSIIPVSVIGCRRISEEYLAGRVGDDGKYHPIDEICRSLRRIDEARRAA